MRFHDRRSGIFIADSGEDLLAGITPSFEEIKTSLSRYILSVSGWRAVMAAGWQDEDPGSDVRDADRVIAAAAAMAFFHYLGKDRPRILLGSDARPTWRVLTAVSARILAALGADVALLGISSAPEIMAYSRTGFDGFFYISASHNPVGHNGFKFGVNGGVLAAEEAEKVRKIFMESITPRIAEQVKALSASLAEADYGKILQRHDAVKERALRSYSSFVERTARQDDESRIPFGAVIDFNGSARSVSADIPFLSRHGARLWTLNSIPGQIAHAIVPEGSNLDTLRRALGEAHARDSRFIIGYMPDNDGDRGNFVYVSGKGRVRALTAQEGFALVAAIELAHAAMMHPGRKIALAANGPTSLLADDVAQRLGAKVFRADVGEANVVSLAESLRRKGYLVPICGEGSNGGCIIHPSRVRDPLNSLMSIAKLWTVPGLHGFLMGALGRKAEEVSIDSVLSAFPSYYMTPAFSPDAVLAVGSADWPSLKKAYIGIVSAEAPGNMPAGAASFDVREYSGSQELIGASGSGGCKVQFYSRDSEPLGYLWLSRSRTEPVCRVMVNIRGRDRKEHDRLLAWQRSMAEKADRLSG